ncbi:MAG: hypothetical protein AMXMBFR84_28490 [Candidatus Hydrogenedentota bacterium]
MYALPMFKGIAVGLAIAAPVGPIGVLCIRKTLAEGRAAGFACGLGAATADGIYGAIAAFGMAAATAFLTSQTFWLSVLGGLFICWLGYSTFRSKPAEKPAEASGHGYAKAYATTFLLTLTNPMTILSFAAIIAAQGFAGQSGGAVAGAVFVFGVFLGSALWWLMLSLGVGHFRSHVSPARMRWINWISGTILVAFGVWSIVRAFA